mmetsp:Transcript_24880/g.52981  ORF Transcript_24880/g.52981 Transcript_24880/m.52981 type:complete len:268 (-) Transcript_24880:192-995(-)
MVCGVAPTATTDARKVRSMTSPSFSSCSALPCLRSVTLFRTATEGDFVVVVSSSSSSSSPPSVWALGDCSEIVPALLPSTPRTAQAAMQQADVVASNVLAKLSGKGEGDASFEFRDLGSMLSLGGPNAAILGPRDEDSQIATLLVPLLDTARVGLGVADTLFAGIVNSPQIDRSGDLKPVVDSLGLSLGGYGLGVDPETTPGTISGTLSGAGRRAIYALRMPTNKQRAYAGASAFLSSAAALAKEASDQIQSSKGKSNSKGNGEKRR